MASYEITAKISEGGMGVVYRAQHQLIGKPAAVKVLHPELSSNPDIVNRFFNEARGASSVRHPGIVEIYDFGYLPSGMAYIVMEFLDGEPLSRRLAGRHRLDEAEALAITRACASALAAAHAQGIVHRDLKPDNIFLVPDPDMPNGERPKLLDFGIAKIAESQRAAGSRTRTGTVMGTPTYMSPEQCRGAGAVDHRADLYSLGCVLYEMLTGRPPFVCEGFGEIIAAHMFAPPEPPAQILPSISMATEALTLRLLAKSPDERVGSAAELVQLVGSPSVPPPAPGTLPPATMALAAAKPPPTVTPTTLSGAAAESSDPLLVPRRSRASLWAAVGAAVVVAGAVAIFLGVGGGKGGGAAVAPPTPAAASDAAALAEVVPDAAPATLAGAGPAAAVDAAPAAPSPAAVTADATGETRGPRHPRKDPHKGSTKGPRKDPKKDPGQGGKPAPAGGSPIPIETEI